MDTSTLAPGAIFATDFRIVRPLASGGMGAVYVVEQVSTRKQRALKVMRPEIVAHADMRQRFVLEAQVPAEIESDHVVEVIGAGIDGASGAPWLAMELLSGTDLGSFAAKHAPLDREAAAALFRQLGHGLGAAHDKRVVHRDLKPENIFLATSRRADVPFTVKILDFGIAKVLTDARTRMTAAIGTPLWMSPEQTASSSALTPAADVWALGLIAFYLLTGKLYWRAAHAADASTAQLLRELLMEPMEPASRRAAAQGARTALPEGFDAWFARATARAAADRFPDATSATTSLLGVLRAERVPPPLPASVLATQTAAPLASAPTMAPLAHATLHPVAVATPATPPLKLFLGIFSGALVVSVSLAILLGRSSTEPSASAATVVTSTRLSASVPTTDPLPPSRAPEPVASAKSSSPAVSAAPKPVPPPAAPSDCLSLHANECSPPTDPLCPCSPPPAPVSVETGTLSIGSIPAANVIVDGKPFGTTPTTATVGAGQHTVVFVFPSGNRKSVSVAVRAGKSAVASAKDN